MSARRATAYETVTAAVDVIRYLKERYNYRKLSSLLKIPQSTLTRYVRGETVPRLSHARRILEWGQRYLRPEDLVREFVNGEDLDGFARIVTEPSVVRMLAGSAIEAFTGRRILGVLSIDHLALPIATAFALLTGTKLFQLSEGPQWGRERSFPIFYRHEGEPSPKCLWCPTSVSEAGDGMLLMTLAVTHHAPLSEVIKALEERKVRVSGIYTLVAKRRVWNELRVPVACKKHAVLLLS
ncbi:MAG: hypothetical protein QXO17_00035 [Nitrososphaerota archaeon]|nr:hypothetical protein [Candidatus Calditenuis fumarioli]